MAIQPQLLEILACPICKEEVRPVPLSEARRAAVRDKFRDKMRGEERGAEDGSQCVNGHRGSPNTRHTPGGRAAEALGEEGRRGEPR